MNHAARLTDDAPVALAKRAIALLEQKLAAEHGLHLQVGSELEFIATMPDAERVPRARELGTRESEKKSHGFGPAITRPFYNRDRWFPDSQRVAYSYREHTSQPGVALLEVVLTHRPTDRQGEPIPQSAMDATRAVEAVRHQLRDPARGYKQTPGLLSGHGQRSARHWQDFRKQKLDDLSFSTYLPEIDHHESMPTGLHFNTSLADGQGRSVMATLPARDRLIPATLQLFDEGNYLLIGSPAAAQRHEDVNRLYVGDDAVAQRFYFKNVKPHGAQGASPFIENKLMSADCNPYYAMMLQLLAYDRALGPGHPELNHAGQQAAPLPTTNPALWHTRFLEGGLRAQLNALEPELGNTFFNAIAQQPPGTEQTAMDKRHSSNQRGRE